MNRFLSRSMALKLVNGATVLLVALAVRLLYLFAIAPRQLCGLNDRANFDLAAAVGTAMNNSSTVVGFGKALTGQFFGTSTALDALVRQGPIYPLYLAALVRWFGLKPGFDPSQTSCIQFAIANAVLSACSCVLIYYAARFAFNRRTALIAALIVIFYTPAVVNIMHCYPETLCNFLVSAWLCLICSVLLRHEKLPKLPALFFIGVFSALIVLCTPSLLLMPPLMAAALILYKLGEPLKRKFAVSATTGSPSSSAAEITVRGETVAGQTDTTQPSSTDGLAIPQADTNQVKLLDFSAGGEAAHDLSPTASTGQTTEDSPQAEGETVADVVAAGDETGAHTVAEQAWSPVSAEDLAANQTGAEDASASNATGTEAIFPPAPGIFDSQSQPTATPPAVSTPIEPGLNLRKLLAAMSIALAGVALIIAPWLWLQHAANNTLDLFSEPTISSRLWLGNMLASDGWKLLPGAEFPFSSVRVVARNLINGMMSSPVPYVTLVLQKFARIWCGGWNDYEVVAYGLNACAQNVLQSLLLLSAYLGFCFVVMNHLRWRLSRAIPCAVAACVIVLSHCWLAFFDPLSRDNLPAMPAIILLSAYCLQHLLTQPRKQKLQSLVVIGAATSFFAWLQSGGSTVPLMMEIFASDTWARGFDVLIVVLVWVFLAWLILPIVQDITGAKVSLASDMVKLGCFGVALVVVSCGMTDDRWRQWSTDIKNHRQQVDQQLSIPQLAGMLELNNPMRRSPEAFVLIDLDSPGMLPPVSVSVNDVVSTEPPMPWIELKALDAESLRIIQSQADGMGKDWRTFRQWWAVAIPFSALKFGEPNRIEVSFSERYGVTTYKVFGEYGQGRLTRNDSYKIMPSLSTLSWEKGFASYEAGDMRLFETPVLQGRVTESSISTDNLTQRDDLSFDHGRQTGQFRIRLAIPENTSISSLSFATIPRPLAEIPSPPGTEMTESNLFTHDDGIGVSGSDPKTANITPTPINVNIAQPGMRCLLSCEAQSLSGSQCGSITVEFSGDRPSGDHVTWTSPWAPHTVPLSADWHAFSFCDFVPENITELSNLKVSITATPQDHARDLLHPHSSHNQVMVLKKLSLTLLPPLNIPNEKDRDWVLF